MQRIWDFCGFVYLFFKNNLCDRKLLMNNMIFMGLVEKAVGVQHAGWICWIICLGRQAGENEKAGASWPISAVNTSSLNVGSSIVSGSEWYPGLTNKKGHFRSFLVSCWGRKWHKMEAHLFFRANTWCIGLSQHCWLLLTPCWSSEVPWCHFGNVWWVWRSLWHGTAPGCAGWQKELLLKQDCACKSDSSCCRTNQFVATESRRINWNLPNTSQSSAEEYCLFSVLCRESRPGELCVLADTATS